MLVDIFVSRHIQGYTYNVYYLEKCFHCIIPVITPIKTIAQRAAFNHEDNDELISV